jgi:hypothetical protein
MAQARTARYKRCVILSPQMEHALRTFVVVNPQSSAEGAARRRIETKERHDDYKTIRPRGLCRHGFER